MTPRLRRPARDTITRPGEPAVWGRPRLLMVLVATLFTVGLLCIGLAYAIQFALTSSAQPTPTPTQRAHTNEPGGIGSAASLSRQERRDRIAAAPMLTVRPADAKPSPPATTLAEPLLIPAATTSGPTTVPSGFPPTPEGAVGQLAAIETTVLQAMSIPVAHAVHDAWALPGAGGADTWSMTGHVRSFLGAARMGPEKDADTLVQAIPAGGQVKGVDGRDWVLACVLLEVRAFIASDARIGYGHCERMQWQPDPDVPGVVGRWMIAPGDPPATAPSTWPGTEKALTAGWRSWADAPAPDAAATASTTSAARD